MTPLTSAPSPSPTAGSAARSNRTVAAIAQRATTGYAGIEDGNVSSSSVGAAGAGRRAGTSDSGEVCSHISNESNGGIHNAAAVAAASGTAAHSTFLVDHVARMQAEIERTTRRLEIEKRRLHELGESSRKAQHEFQDKRLRYSFNKAGAQAERLKAENSVLLLENRVSQALSKLNSANDDINKLKALIDKCRKDRLAMEKVYKRVHRELSHHTEHLAHVKEKVSQLQNWEHQTTKRIDELIHSREQEREAFKQHCFAMQKELREQDRLIKEFDIRSHRESSTQRMQIKGSPYSVAEEEHNFNSESLMKLIFKTALLNAVHRHNIKQYKNKISVFEKAMESIKTSTGISDAEEIVSIFSQLEERNYSVMTYVNNINEELESLHTKKRQLENHMQQQTNHGVAAERLTNATLRDVAAQITNTLVATEGKKALIQRQLQGLLQSYDILVSTASQIRSFWEGPTAGDEPPPRQPGPCETGGEKKNLLPMLWFTQKFFECHRDVVLQAKGDPTLSDALAAAHAWTAAHVSAAAAAGSRAIENGATAAAGNSGGSVGNTYASLGGGNLPLGFRTGEHEGGSGNSSSTTQGRKYSGGGGYVRGRSSPTGTGGGGVTAGGVLGCSGGAGKVVSSSSSGNLLSGKKFSGGGWGSVSHRRTISASEGLHGSGNSSSGRGNAAAAAGDLLAASAEIQPHTRKQLVHSITREKLGGQGMLQQRRRSVSASASAWTTVTGCVASAAIAADSDAAAGGPASDAAPTTYCGNGDSCAEIGAEAARRTKQGTGEKPVSVTARGAAAAKQADGTKGVVESCGAGSDEEEEEERDEDSSDDRSLNPGEVVPFSSEELRERTIYLFNRRRRRKAAAEGNTQPPTLYLPEKRCLLASPAPCEEANVFSPLLPAIASSPLPASPLAAADPLCLLMQQTSVHAGETELTAAESDSAAGAATGDSGAGTTLADEAAAGIAIVEQERQERRVGEIAEIGEQRGSVNESSQPKHRECDGGTQKKKAVPRIFTQTSRMLFGRQKDKQYSKMEPARRSATGAAVGSPTPPKRVSISQNEQQSSQQNAALETKSSRSTFGEMRFWGRKRATKQGLNQLNAATQGARFSEDQQSILQQQQFATQKQHQNEVVRRNSSLGVSRVSIFSRKKTNDADGKSLQSSTGRSEETQARDGHTEQEQQQTTKREGLHDGDIVTQRALEKAPEEGQRDLQQQSPQGQQGQREQAERLREGNQHQQQEPQHGGLQSRELMQHQGGCRIAEQQPRGIASETATTEVQAFSSHLESLLQIPEQQRAPQQMQPDVIREQQQEQQQEIEQQEKNDLWQQQQTEEQMDVVLQQPRKEDDHQEREPDRRSPEIENNEMQQSASLPRQCAAVQQRKGTTHTLRSGETAEQQEDLLKSHFEQECRYKREQQKQKTEEEQQNEKAPLECGKQQDSSTTQNQPSTLDAREELPSSFSVVLRQVPTREESPSGADSDQQQRQDMMAAERFSAMPVRFAEVPEVFHTVSAAENAAKKMQQHYNVVAEEAPATAAASLGAEGVERVPQSPRIEAAGRAGATSLLQSNSRSCNDAGNTASSSSSSDGESCSGGWEKLPFQLRKRKSAAILAALWERCESLAAEEAAAAAAWQLHEHQEQRQRETDAAEGSRSGGVPVTKKPLQDAKDGDAQERSEAETFRRERHQKQLVSAAASDAARQSLLAVMEKALIAVGRTAKEQQHEQQTPRKENETPRKQQGKESSVTSAGPSAAAFYASSPFSFLPTRSDWKLSGSASSSSSAVMRGQTFFVAAAADLRAGSPAAFPERANAAAICKEGERLRSVPVSAAAATVERMQIGAEEAAVPGSSSSGGVEEAQQQQHLREQQLVRRAQSAVESSTSSTLKTTSSEVSFKPAGSGSSQCSYKASSDIVSSDTPSRCMGYAENSRCGVAQENSSSNSAATMNEDGRTSVASDAAKKESQLCSISSVPAEQFATAMAAAPIFGAVGDGERGGHFPRAQRTNESSSRQSSPLPSSVAAAAFKAARAATLSFSPQCLDAVHEVKEAIWSPQFCKSGRERGLGVGVSPAAQRVSSAGPRVFAAPLDAGVSAFSGSRGVAYRPSETADGGAVGTDLPARPSSASCTPLGEERQSTFTLFRGPEGTRRTTAGAQVTSAATRKTAQDAVAAVCAPVGTAPLPLAPEAAVQLPILLQATQRETVAAGTEKRSFSATTRSEVAAAAAVVAALQQQPQQAARDSLRSETNETETASAWVAGGKQRRVDRDCILARNPSLYSRSREAVQRRLLLQQQLQVTQPGHVSKIVRQTSLPPEAADATASLHAGDDEAAQTLRLRHSNDPTKMAAAIEGNAHVPAPHISTADEDGDTQDVEAFAARAVDAAIKGSSRLLSPSLSPKAVAASSGAPADVAFQLSSGAVGDEASDMMNTSQPRPPASASNADSLDRSGLLGGRGSRTAPLPPERVREAIAALASSSSTSSMGRPATASPACCSTPATLVAQQTGTFSRAASGVRPVTISSATLALLRHRNSIATPGSYTPTANERASGTASVAASATPSAAAAAEAAGAVFAACGATSSGKETSANLVRCTISEAPRSALQNSSITCAESGGKAGALSPLPLALLSRPKSTISSSGACTPIVEVAAQAERVALGGAAATSASADAAVTGARGGAALPSGERLFTPTYQRPSSAAVAAAIAAGAVRASMSSLVLRELSGSRPVSSQQSVRRLASAVEADTRGGVVIGENEAEQQQQQQTGMQLTRIIDAGEAHDLQELLQPNIEAQLLQSPLQKQEVDNQSQQEQQEGQQRQRQQTHVVAATEAEVGSTQLSLNPLLPASPSVAPALREIEDYSETSSSSERTVSKENALALVSSSYVSSSGKAAHLAAAVGAAEAFVQEDDSEAKRRSQRSSNLVVFNDHTSVFATVESPRDGSYARREKEAAAVAPAAEGAPIVQLIAPRAPPEPEGEAGILSGLLRQQQQQIQLDAAGDEKQLLQQSERQDILLEQGTPSQARQAHVPDLNFQLGAEVAQLSSDRTTNEEESTQSAEANGVVRANPEPQRQQPNGAVTAAPAETSAKRVEGAPSAEQAAAIYYDQAVRAEHALQAEGGKSVSVEEATVADAKAAVDEPSEKDIAPAFSNTHGKEISAACSCAAQSAVLSKVQVSPFSAALTASAGAISDLTASSEALSLRAAGATAGASLDLPAAADAGELALPWRPTSVGINKHVSLNIIEEHTQQRQEEQQHQHPYDQPRRSRQSQYNRRSHMSLLSNRKSTRLTIAEMFPFSLPELQPPEKDSPPGTPPSATSSRPETAPHAAEETPAEEEAFSAVVEGSRFVARVSRVDALARQQLKRTEEEEEQNG